MFELVRDSTCSFKIFNKLFGHITGIAALLCTWRLWHFSCFFHMGFKFVAVSCGSLNTSGEMGVVVAVRLVFGGVWILFRGPLTTTSPSGIKLRLVSLGNWITGKASVGELTLVSVGNSLTEKVVDVSKEVSKEGFWVAATWYILHRHVSIEVSLPSNNSNWFSILDREMVMLFIIVEISVEFLDPTF